MSQQIDLSGKVSKRLAPPEGMALGILIMILGTLVTLLPFLTGN